MENRTNYRRTASNTATASQTGNTIPDTKTGVPFDFTTCEANTTTPDTHIPFHCSGDIKIHIKTGGSGRASYWVLLCNGDKNTGDPVFFTLWVAFAKDAKTICGALPSNGKARIRVNDAFLSVSLADGNPMLVVMSAEILDK